MTEMGPGSMLGMWLLRCFAAAPPGGGDRIRWLSGSLCQRWLGIPPHPLTTGRRFSWGGSWGAGPPALFASLWVSGWGGSGAALQKEGDDTDSRTGGVLKTKFY